jgi:hypothetical protein
MRSSVHHVYARLSGYGLRLVPVWPYSFVRAGDGTDDVVVTRWDGNTAHTVTVSAVGPNETVEGIAEVLDGPVEKEWRIETTPYSVLWPKGFEIHCQPAGDSTPFYLHGPGGALIYPQGPLAPERVPADLAAPGQQVVERRSEPGLGVVELAYEHDGAAWWQAHHLVSMGTQVVVITGQAPATHAGEARQAAELVARTVAIQG